MWAALCCRLPGAVHSGPVEAPARLGRVCRVGHEHAGHHLDARQQRDVLLQGAGAQLAGLRTGVEHTGVPDTQRKR